MLVLSRIFGKKIVIEKDGVQIEITVLNGRGNQIRLGIKAPSDIPVDREEIHKKKKLQSYEP